MDSKAASDFWQAVQVKRGFGLLALVLLGLFLLGCVQLPFTGNAGTSNTKEAYDGLVSLAGKTGDPAYCQRAPVVYESWCGPRGPLMGDCSRIVVGSPELCMESVFSSNADPALCANLTDNALADGCFARLRNAISLAVANRSGFFCDRITNWGFFHGGDSDLQGACLQALALYRKDPSVCERIAFQLTHDDCYRTFASRLDDFELCDKTYHAQAECLTSFAVRLGRADICGRISPNSYGDSIMSGKDLCFLRLARPNGVAANLSYCSGIANPFGRYYQCMGLSDASECGVFDDVSYRDECLAVVLSIPKDDVQACQQIVNVTLKSKCIHDLSYEQCTRLPVTQWDDCLYSSALEQKDPSLCGSIDDPSKRSGCTSRSIGG